MYNIYNIIHEKEGLQLYSVWNLELIRLLLWGEVITMLIS